MHFLLSAPSLSPSPQPQNPSGGQTTLKSCLEVQFPSPRGVFFPLFGLILLFPPNTQLAPHLRVAKQQDFGFFVGVLCFF